MTIPTFLQSSYDPTQISLTIESFGKSVAGLVTLIAVLKGVDPALATAGWQSFVAEVTTGAVATYTAYHSAQMIFGIIRKVFARFFPPVATQ